MTEPQDNNTHAGTTSSAPAASVANSAGAMIRAAREKQGLHIAALAAAIKVAPRKLDALENDRWGDLPDATFTRALAQTVCRTLKIDAVPVLERLPAQGSMSLAQGGHALNEPFRDRPGREEPGVAGLAIRPMVWAAGLLMLAALALYLAPSQWWSRASLAAASAASPRAGATTTTTPLVVTQGAVTAPAEAVAPASSASPGSAAGLPAAPATLAAAGATAAALPAGTPAFPPMATGGSTTATETVFLAPPPTAGNAAASAPITSVSTAAPGAKAGTEVLSVRTQRSAWLEVRDASGQVLLRNTVPPGEELKLSGIPPLKVVIGNALATQLQFRGQPVDVVGRSQGNVARFDLP
jgi:cytoskeleton protein RodZ